jgi:hypothetical protein
MKNNLKSFLTTLNAGQPEASRRALLEQEGRRIAGLDTQASIEELREIALYVKAMRTSLDADKSETQIRTSIVKILNETSDTEILEIYLQTLHNLLKVQQRAIPNI